MEDKLKDRGDGAVTFLNREQAEAFIKDMRDVIDRGARSGDWPVTFTPQPRSVRTVRWIDRHGNLFDSPRSA